MSVNKIPASKVQWPGTDENPLGESLLDVEPATSSSSSVSSSWHRSDGERSDSDGGVVVVFAVSEGAAAAVGSRRGDTLGERALGRRDGGKQLLAVFFPVFLAARLLFFGFSSSSPSSTPPLSWSSSLRLSLASATLLFFVRFSGILFYLPLLPRSDG